MLALCVNFFLNNFYNKYFVFKVLDSTQSERIANKKNKDTVKREIEVFMGHDRLNRKAPLLVLANKQDLQGISFIYIYIFLKTKKKGSSFPL
jgi:hypothetical protein